MSEDLGLWAVPIAMLGGAIAPAAGAGLVALGGYNLMLSVGGGLAGLGLASLVLAAFRLAEEPPPPAV